MTKELLLEIGTEEIPAAFLPKALSDLEELASQELAAARIRHGQIRTMATPRRLVLSVELADRQEDQVIEKLGPATRVAFDSEGKPLPAAFGFARGQQMDVSELETVKTDKGEYLCARRKIRGNLTESLLPDILPRIILSIPFRKSMRWADLDIRFARPIHWLVAVYGGSVVPFTIGDVASNSYSYGHRFMSPGPFPATGLSEYLAKAKENFVIVDPSERRRLIVEQAAEAARTVGGIPFENEELLEQVTYLTEFPTVVCGSFDPAYLDLPREVLVTTMISHQKYFPVLDEKGALLPHFLTVSNTPARDLGVVRRGNERVIRARLSDARFFFEEDKKIPLAERVEDLKKVVFHTLLGTSYEKVQRFKALAGWIASRVAEVHGGEKEAFLGRVERASWLAKADLNTQMVGEFTELQGVMGREYAILSGEDPIVARAIYEHYLPVTAGGALPESDEGAVVSIADKMDSICGFFGVGLVPTGTADPYALRRQALGVINIILKKGWHLSLSALINESLSLLAQLITRPPAEVAQDVKEFFKARLENQLLSQGHPYDVVAAVLAAGIDDLPRTEQKILAMESFKTNPAYEPLAVAFKRVVNIVRGFTGKEVDPALFVADQEKNLYEAFLKGKEVVLKLIKAGDYTAALKELAGLRQPVDSFFEGVLVMAPEEEVRQNRLALLMEIASLFTDLADFSKIVTE